MREPICVVVALCSGDCNAASLGHVCLCVCVCPVYGLCVCCCVGEHTHAIRTPPHCTCATGPDAGRADVCTLTWSTRVNVNARMCALFAQLQPAAMRASSSYAHTRIRPEPNGGGGGGGACVDGVVVFSGDGLAPELGTQTSEPRPLSSIGVVIVGQTSPIGQVRIIYYLLFFQLNFYIVRPDICNILSHHKVSRIFSGQSCVLILFNICLPLLIGDEWIIVDLSTE